jgi:Methyltransferase domain
MSVFRREILACIEAVRPRRIVEIGSETGSFTEEMTEWAQANGATLVSIDPSPSDSTEELAQHSPHLVLVKGRSPAALDHLAHGDVYLIDGDHNYWTVAAELRHVFETGDGTPTLAILHDVAWPCDYRDHYYDPTALPPEAVHEHSFDGGLAPGEPDLVEGGFRSNGVYAYSLHEGGERNGVLKAVEDFLERHQDLRFLRIPSVFGLGFLFPAAAPWAEELERIIGPLHDVPLLAMLERNRMDLFVRVLDLQDELERRQLRIEELEASSSEGSVETSEPSS